MYLKLVGVLLFLVADNIYNLQFQVWKLSLSNNPNHAQSYSKIFVNDNISHPCDFPPGNVIRNMFYRFSNNFQAA